jgi:hypothetical protein
VLPTALVTGGSTINLSWGNVPGSNANGFTVERSIGGGAWTQLATLSGASLLTSYSDQLADPLVYGNYQYQVKAIHLNGNVIDGTSATVASNTVNFNVPNAPGALTVSTGTTRGSISASWTDNATNELNFTLQAATDSAFTANLISTNVVNGFALPGSGSTVTGRITGLTSGNAYYVRVQANNLVGGSLPTVASTPVVAK